ncbi:hypothetical protein HCH15_06735 [Corynebacterium testudinoris]|uniref:NucA/NucB deoxyribonuclease domain-containing protein n=1 Tax=Corynebacterium testudinoris TaxID=136857 RepID=UPI001C8CE6C3|nr:NucA/NucB deoxyribonuclease domain-containing protein [Corynebacterium testudinoris]MBX8995877.1 hypothetical protein [Corynebacterium testudinoris]
MNPKIAPTLTYSRAEYPFIAHNISSALASGAPSMLTRVTGGEITANRDAVCRGAARRQLEAEQPKPADMDRPSCDEYPFASSIEGGAGAHTMWVPQKENDQQGLKMSAFYRNNQIQSGDNYVVEVIP